MSKVQVSPSDFRCNQCGSQEFVLGKKYATAGNNYACVIRCAHCMDNNGNPHMIKNVNEPYYDALMRLGRVLAHPLGDRQITSVSQQSAGQSQSSRGDFGSVASYIPPDVGLPPEPPVPWVGSEVYPAPELRNTSDSFATYTREEHLSECHPDISAPSDMKSRFNPAPIAAQIGSTLGDDPVDTSSKPVAAPDAAVCPACKQGIAVKVTGSPYAMQIKDKSALYYDELTGRILFTQTFIYCPMCGGVL